MTRSTTQLDGGRYRERDRGGDRSLREELAPLGAGLHCGGRRGRHRGGHLRLYRKANRNLEPAPGGGTCTGGQPDRHSRHRKAIGTVPGIAPKWSYRRAPRRKGQRGSFRHRPPLPQQSVVQPSGALSVCWRFGGAEPNPPDGPVPNDSVPSATPVRTSHWSDTHRSEGPSDSEGVQP